ncbi:MAG: long-chain fatty acid--CoA ligase [Gemmatimonadaceae bacterium]
MTATAPRTTESSESEARGGPRPGPPGTLTQLFFEAADRHDKVVALQSKVGGKWQPISHRTLVERVRRAALGLRALGVGRGDRVAILAENRPEWAIADFACLTSGVTDVPIYPTLLAEHVAYILRDSGAVAVFVSTAEQAAKVRAARGGLPGLRAVIAFEESVPTGADMTLDELERRGGAADSAEVAATFRREALEVGPDDVATIIYTSGTTGEPKGAMLTHDNIYSNVQAVLDVVPFGSDEVCLSFLPLSHILERMAGHYLMHAAGVSVAYAESVDALLANFGEVRPTFVISVPRIYEKIYARVLENALAGGAVKQRIFFWARGVGDRHADIRLAGGRPAGWTAVAYRIADRLVFSKLRARVGGRLRYFVSGGAPLAPEINKFFYSAGLTILEGYGLTETSPVIAVNTPRHFRIGTVGKPVAGVEVRIAPDGEILTRGAHVMRGYFNKPEATDAAIDAEGWMHTGDIGELREGYLRITDRKKDIIVTAGGKNIAPQPIENAVKTNKFVSQAVMLGDKRKFAVMLVVPNFEQLEPWATSEGLAWTEHAQLIAHPAVADKMQREVLSELQGCAAYEQPKRVALLEHDFTIEGGELTPTLKVKRRVIDQRHKTLIDSLYE